MISQSFGCVHSYCAVSPLSFRQNNWRFIVNLIVWAFYMPMNEWAIFLLVTFNNSLYFYYEYKVTIFIYLQELLDELFKVFKA